MADAGGMTRRLRAAARSDAGRVRANNEDLPVLDQERGIYGVIDGVGGHAAGERAAAIARDVILQRLARPLGTPAERVREAIAIANNEIFRRAAASPELAGMTCVVTLAMVTDRRITVGHVGDSRLYKLTAAGPVKLTHDHSPVGEREDAREIGELDAMRHPRRHEVFRDVGSALRDKDEPEYVEVVEDRFDDDAAILVCSDGLTDMIASAEIDRLVRAHAGDPEAVAAALVAAANEAGGRDNVTVVYAEGPGFARAITGSAGVPHTPAAAHGAWAWGTSVLHGRPVWFVLGVLTGLLGALLLAWRVSTAPTVGGRTIAAAPLTSDAVGTLAAAVQAARPGDVIRLEPGTYAEAIVVPDGVSLRARVPGASVFVRPESAEGEWVAVEAGGEGGGAIAGIRVESTADRPVQVGVRVGGHGRALELLQMNGVTRAGVELVADASVTLHGSHLSAPAAAIVLAAGSRLEATGNVFVREADGTAGDRSTTPAPPGATAAGRVRRTSRVDRPAITVGEGAQAALRRNVFAGFGPDPVTGLSEAEREPLRAANVVVSSDVSPSRRQAGVR